MGNTNIRCKWCCDNGILQTYHDEEWGIPLHDDQKHFEALLLEAMQCGLNWMMMLKKRDIFRSCFDAFDFHKIAQYDDKKIAQIMETPGMIKSRAKIAAIIGNAKAFLKIIEEYGSFDRYFWGFTNGKTLLYKKHQEGNLEVRNELSDTISKDFRKKGFKYLGSITVYSYLQACGMIHDHEIGCFLYDEILQKADVEYR